MAENDRERTSLNALAAAFGLNEDVLDELRRGARLRRFSAGELIIRQGENGDSVFVLLSGAAEAILEGSRKQVSLAILQSGEFFGELALLGDQQRSTSVRAVTDSELLEIEEADFRHAVVAQGGFPLEVVQTIARRLGQVNRQLLQASREASAQEALMDVQYQESLRLFDTTRARVDVAVRSADSVVKIVQLGGGALAVLAALAGLFGYAKFSDVQKEITNKAKEAAAAAESATQDAANIAEDAKATALAAATAVTDASAVSVALYTAKANTRMLEFERLRGEQVGQGRDESTNDLLDLVEVDLARAISQGAQTRYDVTQMLQRLYPLSGTPQIKGRVLYLLLSNMIALDAHADDIAAYRERLRDLAEVTAVLPQPQGKRTEILAEAFDQGPDEARKRAYQLLASRAHKVI